MPRVLIVDDEEPLRASLTYALTREGYSVTTAEDGASALEQTRTRRPDVVILDLMLPGIDGMEVCRRLRADSDVPVVMLTARDRGQDKIDGLTVGADDYVTKPFDTPELIARIAAVLRRRASAQRLLDEDRLLVQRMEELLRHAPIPRIAAQERPQARGRLDGGRVVVDLDSATVLVRGRPIATSAAEYALLRLLLSYPGRVVTRTELIERTWGPGAPDGHTLLAVHIRCLREKIEEDPAQPRLVITVPGIGFRYDLPS
ncbi:two-component system, OmpR family, response regulator RegX3 [Nannocystis exedens]|uniref:Two-component system, OmpR family, response regulator RegX3 n=1 Tax=Nannocystis exedens TaxID=54 RepID=A0A1I2C9N4_9BACT|nr:response regulator transcription factor [Nannocystis exedens]PCC68441.1 hisitidine kinase [Nannocystis exedens]SFE65036.1 two-component system, OmpR family, response regulator RegX3 [Nannocystis exedens]